MLVKLLSSQVGHYWDELSPAIEKGLPFASYASDKKMQNILTEILLDRMQCWLVVKSAEVKGKDILGVLVTRVVDGGPTLINNLEIYSMYAYKNMSNDIWKDFTLTLRKFAKSRNCYRLIAYTNNARVLERADKLGATTDYRFITLEVDGEDLQ